MGITADEVERAASGSGESSVAETFEEFYRRRFLPMVRFAVLVVGNSNDAVEVVQDAFASVYPRYGSLRGNLDAYLQTTTLNGCRRLLRRRKVALTRGRQRGEVAELGVDHVLDAVRRLGSRHRDVVLLRFYLDLSEAEIAEVLRVPRGTVKSRLNRALHQLREDLT